MRNSNKNHSGSLLSLPFLLKSLILMLPITLFFSYHPVMYLGASESMYFELSLPLVWLAMFFVVGLVVLAQEKKMGEIIKGWRLLLFPAFLTLSIAWSENLARGVLTAGVLWLVYFAGFVIYILRDYFWDGNFRRRFWWWFFLSAIVACLWCVLQCVLDLVGVSREYSLMCAGCTYSSFGFPHPNGFAIEPQFMGNLLLAPAIMSAWLIIKQQSSKKRKRGTSRGDNFDNGSVGARAKLKFCDSLRDRCKNYSGSSQSFRFLLLCFFIFTATLFLTFSRGAIYAFFVALVFMTGFLVVRRKTEGKTVMKRLGTVWGLVVGAFLFTLNMQGVMAEVSPTNDTYFSGVSKVVNHLSLGIIDIRGEKIEAESEEISEESQAFVSEITGEKESEAVFDGYVAESTDIRVGLSKAALQTWAKDWQTMLFGVGIGGAGQAMYEAGLMPTPREITQNQYTSLLLETGVVGVSFLVIGLLIVVRFLIKKSAVCLPILVLIVAYGVSLVFFSGLPNALHIYLLPVVIYISLRKKLVS